MRIFITGFMGSGKSFTGLQLAKKIGRPFVDLDQWIEDLCGRSIKDIFAQQGEEGFRKMEAEALRSFDQLPYFVMATGGGTPCFHGNMDWMNDHGMTIFLDPPVGLIAERLSSGRDHRPLLQDQRDLPAFIEQKMVDRRPHYERAHVHVQPVRNTDVADLLARQITNITGH